MRDLKTKKLVYLGLLTAAITVATAFLKYPVGTGFIHLGDGIIFLAAIILGPISAASAAIGSAIADFLVAYPQYAPASFVIKALMALFVAYFIKKDKKQNIIISIIIFIIAELIMISGYFIYDIIFYNIANAITNMMGNLIQATFGVIIGTIFLPISKKIKL